MLLHPGFLFCQNVQRRLPFFVQVGKNGTPGGRAGERAAAEKADDGAKQDAAAMKKRNKKQNIPLCGETLFFSGVQAGGMDRLFWTETTKKIM
ncbi:MAG TPA: hypothetical protein H9703_07640 [Candidatus Faecalibacterium faecigallinarum]|uniref:Uncharacterized protein n=1 Tax=Candidatus Faecalibacterium faecigallinarum TaxID=2838577 RepID=A0A9D2PAC8_9FIRM|nr:hypothetical protein [Candidatus Faecalibacterium faecigallinarum]